MEEGWGGKSGERRRKAPGLRWTDGLTVNGRQRWRGGEKKELLFLFLLLDIFQDQKELKKSSSFSSGIWGDGSTRSSCQWVFFLGFFKSAACPNLEDIVYSWWKDKPARPGPCPPPPPPPEQSGHYQGTKKECSTATSIWFWLEDIQGLCKFY